MHRLIDANGLRTQFDDIPPYIGLAGSLVQQYIDKAPTVDAVEVVHGEWIMCEDENDCEYIECPLCGEQFYDGDNDTFEKPWNYCPNCGAKMDGDGNG